MCNTNFSVHFRNSREGNQLGVGAGNRCAPSVSNCPL